MDLTKLGDGELAGLLIAVGDETRRRLAGREITPRMAAILQEAVAAGIPDKDVDSAIVDAKARAKGPATEKPAPAPSSPAAATPTKGTTK